MKTSVLFVILLLVGAKVSSQTMTTNYLPIGFPKIQDTGNLLLDNENYKKAKESWIATHPEEYKKMATQSAAPINDRGEVLIDESAKNEQQHIAEKNKWIEAHPEEYRKMGGNPEEVLQSLKPKEEVIIEKPTIVLPTFVPIKQYILTVYEAVAADNQKPTIAELEAQTATLKKIFFTGKTILQIGSNNQIRLYDATQIDLHATEKRLSDKQVEWFFENKECQPCSKILYLKVEKEDANSIAYIVADEDEGSLFAYRLSFLILPKQ